MESKSHSFITLPGAIIIAGAIIAIAIIYTHKPAPAASANSNQANIVSASQTTSIAPVTAADHILGNPSAPIKIVEFSDPSCPFCKMFNPTMVQLMNDYGPTGKVAWVYRSFPLDKPDANGNVLHPNAGHEAQAFECAASLGGNNAFWAFEKEWYTNISDDGAQRSASDDNTQITQTAKDAGLDAVAFNDCLSSNRFKDKVDSEYTDGLNAGVAGTPTSIIITPTGTQIPLPGVVAYATLKSTIDTLMTEVK